VAQASACGLSRPLPHQIQTLKFFIAGEEAQAEAQSFLSGRAISKRLIRLNEQRVRPGVFIWIETHHKFEV
jgi:hypothetical protein